MNLAMMSGRDICCQKSLTHRTLDRGTTCQAHHILPYYAHWLVAAFHHDEALQAVIDILNRIWSEAAI